MSCSAKFIHNAAVCVAAIVVSLNSTQLRADFNATVQVNAGTVTATLSDYGLGLHTSPYYNNFGNSQLDNRLEEAGVTTLRYGGGGYADVLHWSIAQPQWVSGVDGGGLSPWWGEVGNFGYVGPDNDFGSFINVVDQTNNGRAVVTVNYGSALKLVDGQSAVPDFGGQPKEAAAQVAYANADASIYGTANDISLGIDQQGNDWKTAGYWARLRASTSGEYQTWATADGVYEPLNSHLAINRDSPVGIEYWEIGNETFGTGYYDSNTNGYSVDYDVPYPHNTTTRRGNPDLSPAQYGQEVVEYAELMKSIDPSIKVGAVLTTPPDDWNWDYWPRSGGPNNPNNKHWNEEVLSQTGIAENLDFVMVHWYPYIGETYTDLNSNNSHDLGEPVNTGVNLLTSPRQKIEAMIDGATNGLDTGADAGVRDWLAAYGLADAEIMVTEFGYFGEVWGGGPNNRTDYRSAAQSLFVADTYASLLERGVTSVQYLELLTKQFLADNGSLTRGPAFYGISMIDKLAEPGEQFVESQTSSNDVRVHAALQDDGSIAIMLINLSATDTANISVDVQDLLLGSSATQFELRDGTNLSESLVSGLGNQFDVSLPARTISTFVIDTLASLAGDFDLDSDVDGSDLLLWQRSVLSESELDSWQMNFGQTQPLAANIAVPEPTMLMLLGCGLPFGLLYRRVSS